MEARTRERMNGQPELASSVLRGVELALKQKLRRRFSADFVSRNAEDLLAQAASEYVAAVASGVEVHNPGGYMVDIAYKRALDTFSKERRAPVSDELEEALPLADPRSPQPLEELQTREGRSQLYEAVARLESEERRVLALVYFEGLSAREAAEPLGVSESTSLRRLRSAQKKLREWLPAIEQGRFCEEAAPQLRALAQGTANEIERMQAGLHLRNCATCRDAFARRQEFAFDVGLAAWLSITTAQELHTQFGDQAVAMVDTAREWIGSAVDRARDLASRFLSSGGGEALGGAASGPLAKTAAACSAAAAACAITGVIGPGVAGLDVVGGRESKPAPKVRQAPAVSAPGSSPQVTVSDSDSDPDSSAAVPETTRTRRPQRDLTATEPSSTQQSEATSSAESQFGVETLSGSSGSSGGATSPAPVTPSGQTSDQAAQQQFGLP